MNAPVTSLAQTEAQKIEDALDTLLSAIIKHDLRPRPEEPWNLTMYSAGDLAREAIENLARTEEGRFAHRLFNDPVRAALVHAVRRLGKRLFEIGGLQAMQDACDRVSERDPRNWDRRTNIMDKRWDGIGRVDGKPGWCC